MTTDTSQPVIIIDHNYTNHNYSEINYGHCMARKADHKQCANSKKIGDYCKLHSEKQNIIRIDEPMIVKSKRTYTKKNNTLNSLNIIKLLNH